jgi:hypothetical protein
MLPGVKKLAKRHSIDATALDGWLKAARDEYMRNTEYSANISRKKEVRSSLEPIAQQAEKLQHSLDKLPLPIQQSLNYWPVGEDSLLGNLSIELPFLADRATEVAQKWKKKKYKDNSTRVAIMRIARAWRRLTGMPAACKTVDDKPDDLAPKYFNGKWHGEFLDFFTTACDIIGVKDTKGRPISADVAVKQFIALKQGNLTRTASSTRERQ